MTLKKCKSHIGRSTLTGSSQSIQLNTYLHPRGCLDAKTSHIDIEIPGEDPCGLKEFFSRSGHCVPTKQYPESLIIDFSLLLGYPCVLNIPGANLQFGGGAYIMLSRSGNLYIAPCRRKRNLE